MNSIDILNSIGEVDDEYAARAKAKKTPYKTVWIALGSSLAACLTLFLAVPLIFAMRGASAPAAGAAEPHGETASPIEYIDEKHQNTDNELTLAYGDAKIFYVADGKISSKTQSMYYKPEDIFAAWREANGIGNEVEFVKCEVKDNSTDRTISMGGKTCTEHTVGDYFIYNLTISKRIEDYYDRIDSELLLESLERTMKDYDEDNILGGGIEYDEYHLILV